ncbi:MAG: DUF4250 domain-containing protein [Gemmiger sp.]|uniref:DUF4250 domain-containing protein n=1 Tax=Gemmiger sp. TaxID=2049027 RepID=UPI002E777F77|nr:DUF4250 domain-containing protein [Gemmiger sp.]MEE0801367.1 DUF4250 domain-containing protein [Gemmiger sp.]
MLPTDPVILLSYVNTRLRDQNESLEDFCLSENVEEDGLCAKLAQVGYEYNKERNQFV